MYFPEMTDSSLPYLSWNPLTFPLGLLSLTYPQSVATYEIFPPLHFVLITIFPIILSLLPLIPMFLSLMVLCQPQNSRILTARNNGRGEIKIT